MPDTETLARDALDWLLAVARPAADGIAWAATAEDQELDPTLYKGGAGIVLAMLEGHRHFQDERYADAALRGARAIAAVPVEDVELSSFYFGLTGMAFALHAVARTLGDDPAEEAARRILGVVRERFDGERWSEMFELLGGNAGIGLGALALGDTELAVQAVEPYLRTAEPTAGGVTWQDRSDLESRFHHISHGTLGIVYALAAIGQATDRADLSEIAMAGAADVVSRNDAGPADFLVPHSDPHFMPELIDRYQFGWCHGPTGDAQSFRLLAQVTGDTQWTDLSDRCWHTVTQCGLPRRIRPGFWDNSGHCCGTAGVLALSLDRYAEGRSDVTFATGLVDDLAARSTRDSAGARWSNHEHRATPSDLPAETGWAMGNAGIARELLRYSRLAGAGAGDGTSDPGYAVPMPDQPGIS